MSVDNVKVYQDVTDEVDISDIPADMYILDIRGKDFREQHKVVKVEELVLLNLYFDKLCTQGLVPLKILHEAHPWSQSTYRISVLSFTAMYLITPYYFSISIDDVYNKMVVLWGPMRTWIRIVCGDWI